MGIKIAGDCLNILEQLGVKVEKIIRNIPWYAKRIFRTNAGGNYLVFEIDIKEASRYELTV